MRKILWGILCAVLAVAVVAQSEPTVTLKYYTAGGDLEYTCEARAINQGPISQITITASSVSNASPASVSATAHGLDYPSQATTTPLVKITGAASGWAGLNGVWKATPTSANAFTVPVDSSGFGSFSGQSITVTTYSPRTTQAQWKVRKYVYDASGNQVFSGYGVAAPGAGSGLLIGPTDRYVNICANRASLAY
jgi:hypothetical protein